MNIVMKWLLTPFHVLAIAMSIALGSVFTFNVITGTGVLGNDFDGAFVGWTAGVAFVLMAVGLGSGKDRLVEYGLLLASGVFIARTLFIGFTEGAGNHPFWFSVAWMVAAVGMYVAETRHKGLVRV